MLSEFGEKARAYRLRHGWLLYDMAMVMRLSTATLSAYECGRKEVPEDVKQALDMLIECESKRGPTKKEIKQMRNVGRELKRMIKGL